MRRSGGEGSVVNWVMVVSLFEVGPLGRARSLDRLHLLRRSLRYIISNPDQCA